MIKESDWWTSPTESEDGRLIMVTGRRDIDKFRSNPRFGIRVEVSWVYDEKPDAAMPSTADSPSWSRPPTRSTKCCTKTPWP